MASVYHPAERYASIPKFMIPFERICTDAFPFGSHWARTDNSAEDENIHFQRISVL